MGGAYGRERAMGDDGADVGAVGVPLGVVHCSLHQILTFGDHTDDSDANILKKKINIFLLH